MSLRSPGRVAGEICDLGAGYQEGTKVKATNILVTKGDLGHVNTGTSPPSWRSTPASAGTLGPFGLILETITVAEASGRVSVMTEGIGIVKADGVCLVGGKVQASSTTIGRVSPFVATDVTASPTETTIETGMRDLGRTVGVCLGSADTFDTSNAANGVDQGLVAVDFRHGGGA